MKFWPEGRRFETEMLGAVTLPSATTGFLFSHSLMGV